MNLVEYDELMESMMQAGFTSVFVGIETPTPAALLATKKPQNVCKDDPTLPRPLRRACRLRAAAGGREIIADPERLEIGGEEKPAGSQHVVAVRAARRSARRSSPGSGRTPAASGRSPSTASAASCAARSASQRCCQRAQARSCARPGELRPQRGQRCAPGSRDRTRAARHRRADAAIDREQRLERRRGHRAAGEPAARAARRPASASGRSIRLRNHLAGRLSARRSARPHAHQRPNAPGAAACPAAAPHRAPAPDHRARGRTWTRPRPSRPPCRRATPASRIACSSWPSPACTCRDRAPAGGASSR